MGDAQISAVLFDVGGPLNTELEHERLIDADIVDILASEGVDVSPDRYAAACERAVASYAPDAHTAMIWMLANGDRVLADRAYAELQRRSHDRYPFQLREGMAEILGSLHGRGLLLGLAANQHHATIDALDALGIGRLFHHREVSGTHGFRKPDVRLFLRCCDDLRVAPEACIMVGDRIDNDIAPARLLGMRTVLLRTGRHIAQQPRSSGEVPDRAVRNAAELRAALDSLIAGEP